MDKAGVCISYYQISQILGTPYKPITRLILAVFPNKGCLTEKGSPGLSEEEFKIFQDTFKIVQTTNKRWDLIPRAQLRLPGF